MNIQSHRSLRPYNTFGLDVKADLLAVYSSTDELCSLLQEYKDMPVLPVGEGSNLLFTGDFHGLVLVSGMRRARALTETKEEVLIEAEAGLKLDDLIAQTTDMGLGGLENLSHIPGTVGAAAVQNVGAYGVEAKDVIERVNVIDRQTLLPQTFSNGDCRFAYRYSRFKDEWKDRYVVTSVVFRLQREARLHLDYGGLNQQLERMAVSNPSVFDVRQAVIEIRRQKLPEVSEYGSAGSFFKNPVVSTEKYEALKNDYPDIVSYRAENGIKIPAAWLIDQCSLKGATSGGARVWDRQPLVIVNTGNAVPSDIVYLAQTVCLKVKEKFNISLEREVIYI